MPDTSTIKLLSKQTEAWNLFESSDITELGYGGAAGGGKTRLGWYLVIATCEQYPGYRWAVGRKELKTLKTTTLAELWVIFKELGYQEKTDYTYDGQLNILKFANGSEVLMLDTAHSPQDPEVTRFGSLPLTSAWLDESNETPEKEKSILKSRVGRNNLFNGVEVKGFWLETFNPNKGHVYRDYYKPWKEKTMPSYRAFVPALAGDNPYLSKAYMLGLERSDKVTKQRLLLGNFEYDSDENKLILYDAIIDLTTNTIHGKKDKYLINDIARFGGDKIVLGEFEGLSLVGLTVNTYRDIDTTKEDIRQRSKDSQIPFSQILSDEDGVGGGVVDGLRGTKGFMGGSTPLEIWDRLKGKKVSANFINLRSQCYFKLAEMITNHLMAIKLRYFKTNIEGYTEQRAIADLQEELDVVKQANQSGQSMKLAIIPKSEVKEAIGRSPDFSDIMMMRMYYQIVEESRIIPALSTLRISATARSNKG